MKRFLSLVILGSFACASLSAKIVRNYSCTSDGVLTFSVDSIDYRKDLTRVYGKVHGRPHTSHRIDEVKYLSAGNALTSTDIDGIDFRRYFQWEDDGQIPIEIDFPATAPDSGVQFLFTTARGQSTTTAKKIATKYK